jgi:hypothetical protein
MRSILIVAGLLASIPLAALPQTWPREHPADAAQRDIDRRFWAGQAEMDRLRAETWRDMQRQQDQRTPEGLRLEGPRLHPYPQTGPRSAP